MGYYFLLGIILFIAYKWWNKKLQKTSIQIHKTQSNFNYENRTSKRIILQVLETVEIIATTKNVDILSSRFELLLKKYPQLIFEFNKPNYGGKAIETLDNYKQLYYDKVVLQEQLEVITNPDKFDLDKFICSALLNCFDRNYAFQKTQLDLLKTQRGKNGRYKKLLENIEITRNLIEQYSLQDTTYYQKLLDSKKLEISSFIQE